MGNTEHAAANDLANQPSFPGPTVNYSRQGNESISNLAGVHLDGTVHVIFVVTYLISGSTIASLVGLLDLRMIC